MPVHLSQTIFADTFKKPRCRAVIQNLWRSLRRILQIHFNRVALVRANSLAIFAERKPLLVTARDDEFELVQSQRRPVMIESLQQFAHADPARFLQLQPYSFRLGRRIRLRNLLVLIVSLSLIRE